MGRKEVYEAMVESLVKADSKAFIELYNKQIPAVSTVLLLVLETENPLHFQLARTYLARHIGGSFGRKLASFNAWSI